VSDRPRPTRSDFVAWRQATTRWADDDVYGHMNNATYFELIDTAVNAHLLEATGIDIRALPAVGVVAEVSCRYFREIGFPEPVDLGLVVDKVGTSSVIYRVGLFQGSGDEAAAEGRFVHVYVDNTQGAGRRSVRPLPDPVRAAVEPLLKD
jgi:acyl-CoA thioester hydrolase